MSTADYEADDYTALAALLVAADSALVSTFTWEGFRSPREEDLGPLVEPIHVDDGNPRAGCYYRIGGYAEEVGQFLCGDARPRLAQVIFTFRRQPSPTSTAWDDTQEAKSIIGTRVRTAAAGDPDGPRPKMPQGLAYVGEVAGWSEFRFNFPIWMF